MKSVACAMLLVAALGVGAALSRAQAPGHTTPAVRAALVDGTPKIGFDATHFADGPVLNKLKSGLPQTLVVRVYLHPPGGRAKPVAFSAQSCRVIYDLWGGSYRVQLDRPGRSLDFTIPTASQVVERCLHVRDLPLTGGSLSTYRGRRMYFSIAVELNPLSQATVKRIRRWLSRPTGGQLGGDAFFGSFVSIFVGREIGSAEKALSFRSNAWTMSE